jgi:hypothetical protein
MKITENYIEIAPSEMEEILLSAIIGIDKTKMPKKLKKDNITTLARVIDIVKKVKHGELFEIRVIG